MDISNPMLMWTKGLNPQLQQQLAALPVLLGGLARQPAGRQIAPSLAQPPPQPMQQNAATRPILGGTISG